MSAPDADGIVFRTDADLRPEGRSGPLTRTLDAYEAYWERWAQTWEFQALIKARPVAGDAELGARFIDAAAAVRLARGARSRRRARGARDEGASRERDAPPQGLADRELKRGRGGIRDIEFAVQLLQLVHGRHDESVRSANTLDALEQLADWRVRRARRRPRSSTTPTGILRTVEHRLQLWDEQQTHTLPTDDAARTRLARVLGFRDRGGAVGASSASTPTTAPNRRACARSTSSCSSRRCSTRSPAPARSPARRPRSGWPRSASSTSSRPAPRCAS